MKSRVWRWIAVVMCAAWIAQAAGPSLARQFARDVADVVEKVMPSVVVVRTESVVLRTARDWFFGTLYGIPERLAGQGSGVIIRPEGYVLTSHHVIAQAEQIEVVLNDGTKYPAELVGRDPMTDLAVLRIRAPAGTRFTAIEFGDSDALRVGEFVIALGSPFSLNSSVTLGIVSQKGRSLGQLPYEDFIQTDAPINPGNSGGPLVDLDGKLVGINAMIQTSSPWVAGNIGIAFAVPANLALRVADDLIRHGSVRRPWLGIQLRDVEISSEKRDGPRQPAVIIGEVYPDTPAAKVGLAAGDRIVKVDGVPVNSARAVQREVFKKRVGDEVRLEIRRDDRKMVFDVITDQMPNFATAPGMP